MWCAPASTCGMLLKWEPVSRAHGRVFGEVLPANTLIEAGNLIGDYELEIELEAEIDQAH